MRKIVFAIFILLFTGGICNADIYNSAYNKSGFISVQAPNYVKYYDIDATNITAKFTPLNEREEKQLAGSLKESYKKAKKIENWISEGNYEKAVKADNNFLPVHIKYYNHFVKAQDYHSALNEMINIKRINSMDRVLDDDAVSYKLGMLFYLNGNYSGALTYLKNYTDRHNPSEDNLWYALADIYFNLNNYESSIANAKKIPANSQNYIPVQEILYNDYYATGEVSNAENAANILVRNNPNAMNYVRLAAVSSADDNNKLEMLNRARDLALTNSDYTNLLRADAGIARLKQKKIDTAVSKLSGFVEKPDWSKIFNEISSLLEPLELSQRQAQFFQYTDSCIARFQGNDLIKCFEHVNREENKLTAKVLEEYRQAYEERLLELQNQQRQQQFYQQTYYERMYMDDFFYMKHPYFFGYW